MNNIYDDTQNNNMPDYKDNLAFDPKNKEPTELERKTKLLEECYLLINHWYMPTKHVNLLKNLRKELNYDKKEI